MVPYFRLVPQISFKPLTLAVSGKLYDVTPLVRWPTLISSKDDADFALAHLEFLVFFTNKQDSFRNKLFSSLKASNDEERDIVDDLPPNFMAKVAFNFGEPVGNLELSVPSKMDLELVTTLDLAETFACAVGSNSLPKLEELTSLLHSLIKSKVIPPTQKFIIELFPENLNNSVLSTLKGLEDSKFPFAALWNDSPSIVYIDKKGREIYVEDYYCCKLTCPCDTVTVSFEEIPTAQSEQPKLTAVFNYNPIAKKFNLKPESPEKINPKERTKDVSKALGVDLEFLFKTRKAFLRNKYQLKKYTPTN